jgi:uncharacterized protein YbaR (Trm112 family)
VTVELAPELLEILACPNCHGSLAVDHERDELVCTAPDCQLAYPVRDGIPVMLIDDARRPGTTRTNPEPPPDADPTPPTKHDAAPPQQTDAAPPQTAN